MKRLSLCLLILFSIASLGCDEPQVVTWHAAPKAKEVPNLFGRWRIWVPLTSGGAEMYAPIIVAEVTLERKPATAMVDGRVSYEGYFQAIISDRGEQKGELALQQVNDQVTFLIRAAGIVSPTFEGRIINQGRLMWGVASSSGEFTPDTWLAQKMD